MASENDIRKGHITFNERTAWNKAVTDLTSHTAADNTQHIPPLPSDRNNTYYLAVVNGVLRWVLVPDISI